MSVVEQNDLKIVVDDRIPTVTVRFIGTSANEDASFLEE